MNDAQTQMIALRNAADPDVVAAIETLIHDGEDRKLCRVNVLTFALVLTGPRTKTLPVAIAEYGAEDITYWSLSAAAAIGIMLPIVLFMMLLQRHLVRGIAFGAVKG